MLSPILSIGQLRLSLPAGYELRAERIARRVVDELARRLPLDGADLTLDRLALPPIEISHSASDHQVASAVASAIAGSVARGAKTPC